MTKIKSGDVTVDLDVLDGAPSPTDAIKMFLPPICAEEILAKCSGITLEAIGGALISLGDVISSQSPPSLRLDISINEEEGVVGKVIVQGVVTQVCPALTVQDAVAVVVRAAAEQGAYQAEDDLRRVSILSQWVRALNTVVHSMGATSTSMMAAARMKVEQAQDRLDSDKAKADADSPNSKNDDG